jgi:hypothetical protein
MGRDLPDRSPCQGLTVAVRPLSPQMAAALTTVPTEQRLPHRSRLTATVPVARGASTTLRIPARRCQETPRVPRDRAGQSQSRASPAPQANAGPGGQPGPRPPVLDGHRIGTAAVSPWVANNASTRVAGRVVADTQPGQHSPAGVDQGHVVVVLGPVDGTESMDFPNTKPARVSVRSNSRAQQARPPTRCSRSQ